jgi:hypothetical protein
MLANFAIGTSSVLTCLADDIGHKGSLPTGVPWVGRLRLMQGVAPINPRGHIDKNLVAAGKIHQAANNARRGKAAFERLGWWSRGDLNP